MTPLLDKNSREKQQIKPSKSFDKENSPMSDSPSEDISNAQETQSSSSKTVKTSDIDTSCPRKIKEIVKGKVKDSHPNIYNIL